MLGTEWFVAVIVIVVAIVPLSRASRARVKLRVESVSQSMVSRHGSLSWMGRGWMSLLALRQE